LFTCFVVIVLTVAFPPQLGKSIFPRDYLVDKLNLTKNQLDRRFQYAGGRDIFNKNKSINENGEKPPMPPPPEGVGYSADFEIRIAGLRFFFIDLGTVRVKKTFIIRLHQHVPDLEHIKSVEDFLFWLSNVKCDNAIRGIVVTVLHRMWGSQLFLAMEREIMTKYCIEYNNYLVDKGTNCPTNRQSGFIKKLITRVKHTVILERVRKVTLDRHGEICYERHVSLARAGPGIVHVLKATVEKHGFNGYLGVKLGHSLQVEAEETAKALSLQEQRQLPAPGKLDFMGYCMQLESSGGLQGRDISELMAEFRKQQAVVISVSEDSASDLSPLTLASQPQTTPKVRGKQPV
jgi:hypothetical protein